LADKIKQRKEGVVTSESDAAQSPSVRSATIRDRLLLQELQELRNNLSPQCTIRHPDPNKLHEFILTIKPREGTWTGGTFHFNIIVPEGYNHTPPLAHCNTRIWHPNIDEEGRVCLSLLRQSSLDSTGWAPTRRLLDVVWGIESLFTDLCDFNDALNTAAAEQYQRNSSEFFRTARYFVQEPMLRFNRLVNQPVIKRLTQTVGSDNIGNQTPPSTTSNPSWRITVFSTYFHTFIGVPNKPTQPSSTATMHKLPVYQVPEYFAHTTYCFYDSNVSMTLDLLELRLSKLEDVIVGRDSKFISAPETKKSIFDNMVAAHAAVAAAERRPMISKMFSRLTELQKYADPHFVDDDSMSTKAKVEIILLEKEKLENMAVALEKIRQLSNVLNHPSFRDLASLRRKLNELNLTYVNQKQRSEQLITASQTLLANYYDLILATSKLLIQWNQKVVSTADE
ncbi:hypothetical protein T265_13346, partial [Opisthorchis viverrini]